MTASKHKKKLGVEENGGSSSSKVAMNGANSVASSSSGKSGGIASPAVFGFLVLTTAIFLMGYLGYWAFKIRMRAIEDYGLVIHEFDPYFNYRAAEYLYAYGWRKFFTWFDYMVWYPLGRPVGSTIYPGMQFIAVWIKQFVLPVWSINDICCMIPAWFGAIASAVVGLIAYECALPENSNSNLFRFIMDLAVKGGISNPPGVVRPLIFGFASPAIECGVVAMGLMAVVPAHLMRSVGGGYDNESVAVTAMNLTFFCWVRSLRNDAQWSWIWGAGAGLSYFYMVASWGGYVFVLNMVGVHAAALVLMGRFSTKVYLSYTLFYAIGTVLAIQIPVVGWTPLKSLEQLGPCVVFLGYQVLQICEVQRKRHRLSRFEAWKLRVQVAGAAALVGALLVLVIVPSGYFGPLSSRVRGLFVQHTKTGNPLVDSVAEHQPASSQAYFQYLHHVCSLAPLGFIMVLFNLSDASSFLLVWGTATYFFSHKMVRLVLLTAPVGTALGGIAAGRVVAWCLRQLWDAAGGDKIKETTTTALAAKKQEQLSSSATTSIPKAEAVKNAAGTTNGSAAPGNTKKGKKTKQKKGGTAHSSSGSSSSGQSSFDGFHALRDAVVTASNSTEGIIIKRTVAVAILLVLYMIGVNFKNYCFRMADGLSHPSIIARARLRDGRTVKVDDYREAYWWLRDNTPEDSRIMAWWDYGYQITAIANRTTLADGNTWNHEHIALLGKALTTELSEGHEIARHLADYVLIWAGGGGDDLAKSPHLARIANSVYRDHCPGDPTCRAFGFVDRNGSPTPMMERSFLYNLHGHRIKQGVEVPDTMFEEVFRSKYGKVRIYKVVDVSLESKNWVADPANRECDVPGSWFCPGKYPPGLNDILSRKKDFAQLEDFNRGDADDDYQRQYFENLNDPEYAKRMALQREAAQEASKVKKEPPKKQKSRVRNVAIGPNGESRELGTSDEVDENLQEKIRKHHEEQREKNRKPAAPMPEKEVLDEIYRTYRDTDDTTAMWAMVNEGRIRDLRNWLHEEPKAAYIRSSDGRGPMWWAYESRNREMVQLLMQHGVPHTDRDRSGKTPADLAQGLESDW